jgi:hypothetical protein
VANWPMTPRADSGDTIGPEARKRFEASLRGAVRRKPAHEDRLAGAVRAVVPYSTPLLGVLAETLDTLVKRGSFARPLYAGGIRALAETDPERGAQVLTRALATEDAGGHASLSAACFVPDSGLAPALARVAASRHPHLAFSAEVARIARGESGGEHVVSLAPKIKESHRIALCVELFVPLLQCRPLPLAIAPALSVLRGAERHLGRWLVFAEIAVRAGDRQPLEEARERATTGPVSARAAWSFVAWALDPAAGAPETRPTVELVSRLSDRPSADRDPTFLYRLAEARVPAARFMLENLAKGSSLKNESAVRAALYLARDHGRADLRRSLEGAALSSRQEAIRGVAAAALFDLGEAPRALEWLEALEASRHISTLAWGALLRAAAAGARDRLVDEPTFRRVQLGWVE